MLVRHSAIYVAAKLMPGVIGMATTAALTRLLRPDQYGEYGLALVIMTFGSNIGFDWLGIAFMRFYQARRNDPLVTATFVWLFGAVAAITLFLSVAVWACGFLAHAQTSLCAAGIMMMWTSAWFELVARFEIAALQPRRYFVMNLARAILTMLGAVGGAWVARDPVWTARSVALATLIAALMHGPRCISRGFNPALARQVLVFGMPMAASMTGIALVNAGTRGLIAMLDSEQALGFYTAGFMLIQNTLVVAASGIASAGYSLAVRAVETGDAAMARTQLLANATLLLAVLAPAALGMVLTAHGIAANLVGPRYVGVVSAITPWMAASAFLASIRANYLDHAFQLGKRPGLQVWVTGVAAVIAIGLCFLLIPLWGSLGAAIATCVAMATACVLAYGLGCRAYPLPLPVRQGARILIACAAMACVVSALPGGGTLALVAQVGGGACTYGAAAAMLDVLGIRRRLRQYRPAMTSFLAKRPP